ncbi:MAG: methyltransferase, TIGR04325 family [Bacteroidetes bacterium]|nr:methyltransferase, TIGR04325 family [Bacteroidota bacterium]
MINALKNMIPSALKKLYYRLISEPVKHGWFGDYSTWAEAQQKCTGYAAENILEKVKNSLLQVRNGEAAYERDSVLFDEVEYSEPLLQAFKMIANENNNTLNVIDFGGSLGSSFFQNKGFLSNLTEFKWNIVEQKHFVDCGKHYFEDQQLKFYYTIEEALQKNKAQVLLLSSVIQYFEKPYELIERCMKYEFDYIIIDRTAFIENKPERITVQVVPEFIYKASYAAWFLNEQKFLDAFKNRYKVMNGFVSEQSKPMKIDQKTQVYWKGFLLKKQNG